MEKGYRVPLYLDQAKLFDLEHSNRMKNLELSTKANFSGQSNQIPTLYLNNLKTIGKNLDISLILIVDQKKSYQLILFLDEKKVI